MEAPRDVSKSFRHASLPGDGIARGRGQTRCCKGLFFVKEIAVSCVSAPDPQLARLADAIAQRVGQQRFHVWFDNSTKLDLKNDGLEIAVPNDFISEWIGRNFAQPIQDAANEVLGCSLAVRFSVVPQLFANGEGTNGNGHRNGNGHKPANGNGHHGGNGANGGANGNGANGHTIKSACALVEPVAGRAGMPAMRAIPHSLVAASISSPPRLRHDL